MLPRLARSPLPLILGILAFPAFLCAQTAPANDSALKKVVKEIGHHSCCDHATLDLWQRYLAKSQPDLNQLRVLFASAATEFGVPQRLLEAIAQVETNWTHVGPSIDRGWGIMHLVENGYSDTLGEAASILKMDRQTLKDEITENVRGAAALLAEYAGEGRKSFTRIEDWFEAAARFSGLTTEELRALQAEEYFKVLREGVNAKRIFGDTVRIEPDPSIDISSKIRGKAVQEKSTDYPPALLNLASSTASPTDTPLPPLTPTSTETSVPSPSETPTDSPPTEVTHTPTSESVETAIPTAIEAGSDINGDGVVDSRDLLILMRDWERVVEHPGPSETDTPSHTPTDTPTAGTDVPTPVPTATPTETDIETPTVTVTPSHTVTETPTLSPTLPAILEIVIPGLSEEARPLRLVRIPAGSFVMGSPEAERSRQSDEGPQHFVSFASDFYMGETEVTKAQWAAVMGNPAPATESFDLPITEVSLDSINEYMVALGALAPGGSFRLPSEAEWEYACRGGTQTRFFFGDSEGCGDGNEDCAADGLPGNRSDYMCFSYPANPGGPRAAGTLLPNPFGLYEMPGNVWEYCQDWYHNTYFGAPEDGSAWETPVGSSRVIRGGQCDSVAAFGRSAARGSLGSSGASDVGFRVVGTLGE